MVSLDTVRVSNSKLSKLGSGLVGIFVGGTSGIGETTAREFVRNTRAPKVYLIGRNAEAASRIQEEFKRINPEGVFNFIQSDLSLLKNVDKACEEIKAKETKVNLLFMSTGFLSLAGRQETIEGLDKKFNVHYYSRFRFTYNLLPLLTKAAESQELSRNVSVLSAGEESYINLDDLSLKTHYSANTCRKHSSTMNSCASIHLAGQYPGTTFTHMFPGVVKTNLMQTLPVPKLLLGVLLWATTPMAVPITESGERHLYAATSDVFAPRNAALAKSHPDAINGNGAYMLNWNNEPRRNEKVLKEYIEQGVPKKIWEHTEEVYEKVCVEGQKY